jgi:hypothetical protein
MVLHPQTSDPLKGVRDKHSSVFAVASLTRLNVLYSWPQRLQQLKAKYQKKRAESELEIQTPIQIQPVAESEEETAESMDKVEPVQMR